MAAWLTGGAQVTAVRSGKPISCWISSTATEQGDLRAACTVGWHPTLPMTEYVWGVGGPAG